MTTSSEQVETNEMDDLKIIDKDGIKIIVAEPDKYLPEDKIPEGICFVTQQNNVFKTKKNSLFGYLSEYKKDHTKFYNETFGEAPYNPKHVYNLGHNLDKYPYPLEQLHETMRYFSDIFDKYGTEAAVLILFNDETKEWRTLRVLQVGAGKGGVTYIYPSNAPSKDNPKTAKIFEDDELKKLQLRVYAQYEQWANEGFRIMGTIHSHCDFSAFHSGTDDNDEYEFDGLHITIGNVNKKYSFSQRWMFSRAEFKLEITEIVGRSMEDIRDIPDHIVTSEEDLELLVVTDVLNPKPVVQYTGNYNSGKHWANPSNWWANRWNKKNDNVNRDFDGDYGNYDNGDYGKFYDPDSLKKFDESVEDLAAGGNDYGTDNPPIFKELQITRLQHNITKEYVWVPIEYYSSNPHDFNDYTYIGRPDKYVYNTESEKKASIVNLPAVNKKHPYGNKFRKGKIKRKGRR